MNEKTMEHLASVGQLSRAMAELHHCDNVDTIYGINVVEHCCKHQCGKNDTSCSIYYPSCGGGGWCSVRGSLCYAVEGYYKELGKPIPSKIIGKDLDRIIRIHRWSLKTFTFEILGGRGRDGIPKDVLKEIEKEKKQ